MTVPSDDLTVGLPSVPPVPSTPARPATARLQGLAAELVTLLVVGLGGGLALGAGWVLFAPAMVRWTGGVEDSAAQDVAFGLLAVLAGLVTSTVLMLRPGRRPAVHTAVVLIAAEAASLIGWGFGRSLGAPTLHALALLVVWPLVAAAIVTVRSLVAVLIGPGD